MNVQWEKMMMKGVQKYQGYIVLVDTIYDAGSKAKATEATSGPIFSS